MYHLPTEKKLQDYQKSIVFHPVWILWITRKEVFVGKKQMNKWIYLAFFVVIVVRISWLPWRNKFSQRNYKFAHSLHHQMHSILKSKAIASYEYKLAFKWSKLTRFPFFKVIEGIFVLWGIYLFTLLKSAQNLFRKLDDHWKCDNKVNWVESQIIIHFNLKLPTCWGTAQGIFLCFVVVVVVVVCFVCLFY